MDCKEIMTILQKLECLKLHPDRQSFFDKVDLLKENTLVGIKVCHRFFDKFI